MRNLSQKQIDAMHAIIVDAIGCEREDISDFTKMKIGMTNDSYLFEVDGVEYVFRVPGAGTEFLMNRYQEAAVYEAIKDLKISDTLFYFDPQSGVKITKYYKDSVHVTQDDADIMISMLRTLHQSGLKVDHRFDIEERIKYYESLCAKENADVFEEQADVRKLIHSLFEVRNRIDRPEVLCHVDGVSVNFLRTQSGKVKLLDWEYAGMADPLLDLAMHTVYEGFNQEQVKDLTYRYFEREPKQEEQVIVYMYVAMAGYLWTLWTQYKEAMGVSFGDYARSQFEYALNFTQIYMKESKELGRDYELSEI